MTDKLFSDSNVVVYAFANDPHKKVLAEVLLAPATQVINPFIT